MKTYLIIHHSATKRDNTSINAIRKDHKKRFGRTFYNEMINNKGEIFHEHDEWNTRGWGKRSKDLCLIGDFSQEKPTPKQIDSLRELIRNYDIIKPIAIIGHKEARGLGLEASESICPANLLDYLRGGEGKLYIDFRYDLWFIVNETRFWIIDPNTLKRGFAIWGEKEEKITQEDLLKLKYGGAVLISDTDDPLKN